MIQRVGDPEPKRRLGEKLVLLSKAVQLRIAVQRPRRHELVKDANDKRRKEGEDDVVESQRPRLKGDLSRKVIKKRILEMREFAERRATAVTHPKQSHV